MGFILELCEIQCITCSVLSFIVYLADKADRKEKVLKIHHFQTLKNAHFK